MRYMGEILEEPALRTLFASRCADPGVFVLRDASGAAVGDIGLRISGKNPHEADVGYALLPEAQGRVTPVKRCGRFAITDFSSSAFTP
jgi:RimJ/RimL family protein N-acetyltransferase